MIAYLSVRHYLRHSFIVSAEKVRHTWMKSHPMLVKSLGSVYVYDTILQVHVRSLQPTGLICSHSRTIKESHIHRQFKGIQPSVHSILKTLRLHDMSINPLKQGDYLVIGKSMGNIRTRAITGYYRRHDICPSPLVGISDKVCDYCDTVPAGVAILCRALAAPVKHSVTQDFAVWV